jgi:hypothetical protein
MLNIKILEKQSNKYPIINRVSFFDWINKDLGFSTKDTIKIIEDSKYIKIYEILTQKYHANKQRKLIK